MPRRILILLAWTGISSLALFLRLDDLSSRPMHADEATGARILAQRLEDGDYQFDPTHFHGPLLSSLAHPVAHFREESNWPALTETTLRLVPAIAGFLMVFTPLLWLPAISQPAALAAAALLASSPLLVYYSRMYIHETILAAATLLALPLLLKWLRQPSVLLGMVTGMFIGLMWAAKETFVITLFAWGIALIPGLMAGAWVHGKNNRALMSGGFLASTAAMVLTCLLTVILFYTDFLRHPAGAMDAVRTYFVYETVAGHEKPFTYYFHLLLWPKALPGGLWWEGLVAVLAVAAVFASWREPKTDPDRHHRHLVTFLGLATAIHFVVYSLIGYKTPWLMVVPWAHACLLAGFLWLGGWTGRRPRLVIWATVFACCLIIQTRQSIKATGRFANDVRNPYAYVPTTNDAVKMGRWLTSMQREIAPQAMEPIAVVGSAYWPLPWYLRDFASIGYWKETDVSLVEYPVVITMPDNFARSESILSQTHKAVPRGIRTDTPVMVYVRNEIWNKWMEDAQP